LFACLKRQSIHSHKHWFCVTLKTERSRHALEGNCVLEGRTKKKAAHNTSCLPQSTSARQKIQRMNSSFWACSQCTLENPIYSEVCEACEAWNPFSEVPFDESTDSDFALAFELAEQDIRRSSMNTRQQYGNGAWSILEQF
jgi:hypothetical protein